MKRTINKWKYRRKIRKDFSFLFDKYKFKYVNSDISPTCIYIFQIASKEISLNFQIESSICWFIYLSKVNNMKDEYGINTLKQYLDGTEEEDQVMNVNELKIFMQNNMSEILNLFSDENYTSTKLALDVLDDKLVKKRFPGFFD